MPNIADIFKNEYGLDTETLITELTKLNLSDKQKGYLVANIVLERLGSQQRRFAFSESLAAADDDCKPVFARTLVHRDWRNGEDVVTAEASGADEGFNARFHHIERDLDALATDAAKGFKCQMELRAQLADLLEEIRAEINKLHADVFALKQQGPSGPSRPIIDVRPPLFPPIIMDPIGPIINPGGPVINPGGPLINPGGIPVQPGGPFINPGGLPIPGGVGTLAPGAGGIWRFGGNETVGVIGGMRANRLAEAVFNGETVEVWTTPIGMVMTPITKPETAASGYLDPRIELTGKFSGWAAENAGEITARLGAGPFSAADLDREFGDRSIAAGITVADVVRGFSSADSFEDVGALADRFSDRQAESIRSAGAGTTAVIGAIGLNAGDRKPESIGLEAFAVLPRDAQEALARARIGTLGQLSDASTQVIAKALRAANVTADAGTIAGWKSMARTVRGLK